MQGQIAQQGLSDYTPAPNNTYSTEEVGGPLTAEIMQRTLGMKEAANHALTRLWSLRDRLYSTPPAGLGDNASATQKAPQAFAEAWRSEARTVEQTLAAVCSLANELSDKL